MQIIYIIYGIIAIVILWFIGIYNSLIRKRNRVREAWSDIDVQLKRRYDLIPNLVQTVKGYAKHEKNLLESVTKARNNAMNAQDVKEKAQAENILSGTLKSIFALSENYPNLKANENFLELQREISDTENKIQASRRFYNNTTMDYNSKIESFPANIVAGVFKFTKNEFFELVDKVAKESVKVEF